VRLGRELGIGDEVSSAIDVQTCPLEQLAFSLEFDRHLVVEDGVDNVSGVDVLITRIPVLFVIVILVVMPVEGAYDLCGVILNNLLSVNIL
jgi:hypothetical protein